MNRFRTRKFDDWRKPFAGSLLLVAMSSGCTARGNSELLEAQLRRQETQILQFEKETARLRSELAQSQQELDLVRAEQLAAGQVIAAEEAVRSLALAKGMVFNSLLTAGQDRDGQPGDEGFHAVFYPHDADGEVVKLAGRLEVEALDLGRPSDQKIIGRWEYTPEQVRQMWLAGFLSSGYQIDEAWSTPPVGTKVLLVAKLTAADGRVFEATHTIPIEVAGGTQLSAPNPFAESASANLLPVSAPVPSENDGETRRVPSPEPWEFDARPAVRQLRENSNASENMKPPHPTPASQPGPVIESGETRPFPSPTVTSDNFTEDTIPLFR